MRVLHLFSNAKWTGPAEPALNLCVALRRMGVDADFACSPLSGDSINKVVETARDRGIEPILEFDLRKHRHPLYNFIDARRLCVYLRSHPYDLIHCHLDNDHRIAVYPANRLGVPIVRSSYNGEGFTVKPGMPSLLASAARIIEPSKRALEHDATMLKYPRERICVIANAVDTERFDPARPVPDGRRWLGIPPEAFVLGIVARMQTHRQYGEFFTAVRQLVDTETSMSRETHVIVVGRGTKQAQVAFEPVRALGLGERVHFSGYVDGENYVGMLKAFDVKVFLVPGSDGTCRAVREAMAMGKPAIVADRGMLAEIVDHEVNGLVCGPSPDALFEAMRTLATDRARTRALGSAAREKAATCFALDVQAQSVMDVYSSCLS